jgi:phytoene/squalene synthetase
MKDSKRVAKLARRMTWRGSKQSFLVGQFLVDRKLRNDFFRAYAYFRWIDDMIDEVIPTRRGRIEFIDRQSELIRSIYSNQEIKIENEEEEILLDLIKNDKSTHNGLKSFIEKMFSIIEFDTLRKDSVIREEELDLYNKMLGISVVDGLQYFIGHQHLYSASANRYEAAIAAHKTHLLRDMKKDFKNGFYNIPLEIIGKDHSLDLDILQYIHRDWIKEQVEEARQGFQIGKQYIENMQVLRCKIAAILYSFRFKIILDKIEKDGFILREKYYEFRKPITWIKMIFSTSEMIMKHNSRKVGSVFRHYFPRPKQVDNLKKDTWKS